MRVLKSALAPYATYNQKLITQYSKSIVSQLYNNRTFKGNYYDGISVSKSFNKLTFIGGGVLSESVKLLRYLDTNDEKAS